MAARGNVAVRIPAALIAQAQAAAAQDDTSVEQFVCRAIEEKIAAIEQAKLLAERARRGSRDSFARLLAKAGTHAPRHGDDIPEGWLPDA
jgi:hypothetical protein